MQKFPMGKVITVSFLLWGITLTASGTATNFATLAVARFFLGIFESCVNPGFILITSSWWKREEQAARIGLWYCANGLLGGPSGLIFWGIAHVHARHMFPYQWMFIIFGLVTIVIGMGLWWLLPDSPVTATFLSERERLIAIERLKSNKTGIKNQHHKIGQIKELVVDLKVWMLIAAIFFHNLTNSLQTTFTGLVIKGFGYSTYQAVLLSIPSGMTMAVTMLLASLFLSSKWGEGKRILVIILCYCPGIIATAMLRSIPLNAHTKSAHLGAVMIIPMVASSAGVMYSLLASNIAGYTKKTVAGAAFFVSNSVSNIVSPQTFLATEAPYYQTGIAVTLAAFCVNVGLFTGLYFLYTAENKRREADPAGEVSPDETEDMIESFSDLTDKQNKKLRYKL
jgi:MFS family permease